MLKLQASLPQFKLLFHNRVCVRRNENRFSSDTHHFPGELDYKSERGGEGGGGSLSFTSV